MGRRGVWVVIAVLTALVIAACGSSSSTKTLPLKARVISSDQLKGFTPFGKLQVYRTMTPVLANGIAPPGEGATWLERLKSEGLEDLAFEGLTDTSTGQDGYSEVMQFGSAGSARAEVEAEAQSLRFGAIPFAIKAVPGAAGFAFTGGNAQGWILFADGPFFYRLGYRWSAPNEPQRAELISGAIKLYQRVHGHPPN